MGIKTSYHPATAECIDCGVPTYLITSGGGYCFDCGGALCDECKPYHGEQERVVEDDEERR